MKKYIIGFDLQIHKRDFLVCRTIALYNNNPNEVNEGKENIQFLIDIHYTKFQTAKVFYDNCSLYYYNSLL